MFLLTTPPIRKRIVLLALSALLISCSPSFNWREVRSNDEQYTVLLPAKPASHSRSVDLAGQKVSLQMTAAEVDDISFAVASTRIEDESQRKAALEFLQQAMVKNIRGSVNEQKSVVLKDGTQMNEIKATGTTPNGRRMALFARFGAKEQRVYQAVAIGPQEKLSAEIADTFLASFTPN